MRRKLNCPARTGGFFDIYVALLLGPRTLSRCLLEKVELGRLAAARQNSNSRGLAPPKIVTARQAIAKSRINHLATFLTCASSRTQAITMSSEPFYLRY